MEPKFSYHIMDLTLPSLSQTGNKLADLLWKGIVEHMPNRPRNQFTTSTKFLRTAASAALMR
eukprot:567181-Amphidinium_carterae.1